MTKPFKDWTVLPHGGLVHVTDDILTVEGTVNMPIGAFPRRMTVVRLASGELVIFSPVSLDESEMQHLEAFGRPSWLIAPSSRHRLDAPSWKQRYPQIKVAAPPDAVAKVSEVVMVDSSAPDFRDPKVRFVDTPGMGGDAALEVDGADGTTLIVNEFLGNIHGEHGLKGWLLGLMGFKTEDEPHIPAPVKMTLRDGKAALKAQLERWAEIPDLRRIIVSHGDIIDRDPAHALRAAAAELGS